MRTMTIGLLLSTLALTACGAPGGDVEADPDDPVLQIVSEGGFVPVEVALGSGPRYTLLGDGRLIFGGVTTLEFPGRLVPPYLTAELSGSQMNAVLAMVDKMGLADLQHEVDDDATNFVADATTEVITYWDDNGAHVYSVYALGIQDSPTDRNATFLELIETFDRFTAGATARPYEPERVRVISGPGFVDANFEDVRPWPFDDDPGAWTEQPNGWKCRVFEAPVLDMFVDATQATTWETPDGFTDSGPTKLLVRPLLPGEPDCP